MEEIIHQYDLNTLKKIKTWFLEGQEVMEMDGMGEDEEDLEVLQAIVYSIMLEQKSPERFFLLVDLMETFYLSHELISALLDSCEERTCSEDTLKEFYELFLSEHNFSPESSSFLPIKVSKGEFSLRPKVSYQDIISFISDNSVPLLFQLVCAPKSLRKIFVQCLNASSLSFGVYKLESYSLKTGIQELISRQQLFITSPIYEFIVALENFTEFYYWEFHYHKHWNHIMENNLLELLICIHEDFRMMITKWKELMSGMSRITAGAGGGGGGVGGMSDGMNHDFERFYQIILNDLQIVLSSSSSSSLSSSEEGFHGMNYAIGRLHQTFEQLLEIQYMSSFLNMFQLPPYFHEKIQSFIVEKCNVIFHQEKDKFQKLFSELMNKAEKYYFSNPILLNNPSHSLKKFLDHFKSKDLDSSSFSFTFQDLLLLLEIKPKMLDTFFGSATSSSSFSSGEIKQITFMPCLPKNWLLSPQDYLTHQILPTLRNYSETLFGDIIQIDSMLGYSFQQPKDDGNQNSLLLLQEQVHLLENLLALGLTYSFSDNEKLIISFPVHRACLRLIPPSPSPSSSSLLLPSSSSKNNHHHYFRPIWKEIMKEILPKSFMKRVKDLKRIFKNKIDSKHGHLSFAINTDFHTTIQKLKEYHKDDCWITPSLEKVWYEMMSKESSTFFIFELWYHHHHDHDHHEEDGATTTTTTTTKELLAADFAHLIANGKFCYVATRYSNRDERFKTIPSGFLLAILVVQYLYENGCLLWDLGGVNHCPLMRYKYELVGNDPEERPMAFEWFHEQLQELQQQKEDGVAGGQEQAQPSFPQGVILEPLTIDHIL